MNEFEAAFEQDGLHIKVDGSSNDVVITWRGTSDILHPEVQLSSFLNELLPNLQGRNVKIDLCKFNYMNSATFGPLLQFIKGLDRSLVPTLVAFNNQQQWQRLMFQCMKTISRSLTHVQVQSL
jgi:hypothetical protein